MALNQYKNKKGLVASVIGVFCDCEFITEDDGFDSKLNFRLPFYRLLEGYYFTGTPRKMHPVGTPFFPLKVFKHFEHILIEIDKLNLAV